MIGVDFGDEERHVALHPVVARVADDDVAGFGEGALDLAGDRRIEAGEQQLRRAARRRRVDLHPRHLVGQRRRQSPRGRLAVRLAFRSLARAEPGDLEPRMLREQCDELLPDRAGRPENPDLNRHDLSRTAVSCRVQKKSRRGL